MVAFLDKTLYFNLHNLSPSMDLKGCTEIVWKWEKMLGEVTFDGSVSHPEKALMPVVALR